MAPFIRPLVAGGVELGLGHRRHLDHVAEVLAGVPVGIFLLAPSLGVGHRHQHRIGHRILARFSFVAGDRGMIRAGKASAA